MIKIIKNKKITVINKNKIRINIKSVNEIKSKFNCLLILLNNFG